MKKVFVSILLMLFISGCSKGEAAQSDSADINSTAGETNSFTQAWAELKPMDAEQSSYYNSVNLKGGVPGKM